MSIKDKDFYNRASAHRLGWDPSWFSAEDFDDDLIRNIKLFQKSHDLEADGLCGPKTYRCIVTSREAMAEMVSGQLKEKVGLSGDHIVCDGVYIPIAWDKVINLYHEHAMRLPRKNYRVGRKGVDQPTMIVTHFDVCLSAKSCYRVLEKKGISSHFSIDNDGTIYQMVDTANEGWHAGNHKVNRASVGVDLSNAIYLKYQKHYRARGFANRPILENIKVHRGTIKQCLGFYPVQIKAYKALIKTLCDHYNIPIQCPLDSNGKLLMTVAPKAKRAKFHGIVSHYHLTRNKWDTANLELDKVLEEIRNETD